MKDEIVSFCGQVTSSEMYMQYFRCKMKLAKTLRASLASAQKVKPKIDPALLVAVDPPRFDMNPDLAARYKAYQVATGQIVKCSQYAANSGVGDPDRSLIARFCGSLDASTATVAQCYCTEMELVRKSWRTASKLLERTVESESGRLATCLTFRLLGAMGSYYECVAN